MLNKLNSYNSFIANNSNIKEINISVYLVSRASFNDERLIETKRILVDDIKDKPLLWFDVYLGKNKNKAIKIAFVYLDDKDLYFFEDAGENMRIIKRELFSYIYSDDYNESYIISAHIW